MGRFSTGAITTGEAQRIELSWLIKQGWISKGGIISGTLSWNNGSEISINTEIKEGKGYIDRKSVV